MVSGRVIGVVHIGLRRQYTFTSHDIALLERVAHSLAQAIERTRLAEVEQQARIEASLRVKELESIFEALTDGLIVYDQQGQVIRSNSTARHMLGMESSSANFTNRSLAERVAMYLPRDEFDNPLLPEDLPIYRLLSGERLTGKNAENIRIYTPDKKDILVNITGTPFYDEQKKICGAICILRDITEQRLMRRRLQILDALIEIVETLVQYAGPLGIIDIPGESVVTSTQRLGQTILALAQPLLGYSHALIFEIQVDSHILSLLGMIGFSTQAEDLLRVHPHLSALIPDPAIIALLQRQELIPFEIAQSPLFRDLFPDGSVPNCLFVPIYVASCLAGLFCVAFADRASIVSTEDKALLIAISKLCALALQYEQQTNERNRLGEARDLLNEQLEHVNELQSTFISVVGHEFRTALTGIEGFSSLLIEEDFTSEETREFACDINKDAVRLHHMITDLLDLEQMKKGKMQLHVERVDINAIMLESVKRIRLTKPDYPLHMYLDPQHPCLQGDPDKLNQVISNLLSNAVKYSPDRGEIVVRSVIEGKYLHVSVQDHGIGIPPERLKDVFMPYQRIASQSTRYIQGTGLGLGIVKQIVELHQGEIWVESVLGRGSLFHVTLPLEV